MSSESMLSSYFKNFRYTEDFKRSGKVYIKDTSAKTNSVVTQTNEQPVVSSTTRGENKTQTSQPVAYVATFKNLPPPKTSIATSNEIINVAQLVDFDSFVAQTKHRAKKKPQENIVKEEQNVINIDLTRNNNDFDLEQLRQPHIKSNPNKIAYSIKIDEAKGANQTVLINPLPPELNQNQMMYAAPQINPVWTVVNTPPTTINMQIPPPPPPTTTGTSFQTETTNRNYNTTDEFVVKQAIAQKEQSNNVVVKNHVCEICSKAFKRREHLYQHMKMHRGFRAFTCESCNKSFLRKEHLLRHMTSHSGQKNYTCNICEKSFSRNDNLLKHRRTHEKQNSFTCEVCHKQFVMKHYYMAHKLTHETEKCGLNSAWGLLKV